MMDALSTDAVIFGGGAAGLWLLDELSRAGCRALLLEAHELGSGQTIASQGIIHGGLKYTLSGLLTPSARAISEMPMIWRRCLAGEAKPDLANTRLRAAYCHLWRTTSLKSKLAMIGARAGLRITPTILSDDERPAALRGCPGVVARLDEQVIEPASLLNDLLEQHRDKVLKIDLASGLEFVCDGPGQVTLVRLINPESGEPLDLRCGVVIFTAGEGNAALRSMAGLDTTAMQRRPLHMVMVRSDNLPPLNAHCVDGAATRVTITTTRDFSDRTVWQVGGQIAERGTAMSREELIAEAQRELPSLLPGVDFALAQWSTYRVDRAEAAMRGGQRPEDAHAAREGNVITAWPTKLALVPELSRRIMGLIRNNWNDAASRTADERGMELDACIARWPRPVVALPPWEIETQWCIGH